MRANRASGDSQASPTLQDGDLGKVAQPEPESQEGQTETVQTALLSPKLELQHSLLEPLVLPAGCSPARAVVTPSEGKAGIHLLSPEPARGQLTPGRCGED